MRKESIFSNDEEIDFDKKTTKTLDNRPNYTYVEFTNYNNLDNLGCIDLVLWDKTGTLTSSEEVVSMIYLN